jgi:hypothetical protein
MREEGTVKANIFAVVFILVEILLVFVNHDTFLRARAAMSKD